MSPDLFTHSVSYFAEAPLAHHSSTRVRHIVYSCVPKVGRWGGTSCLFQRVRQLGLHGGWAPSGASSQVRICA